MYFLTVDFCKLNCFRSKVTVAVCWLPSELKEKQLKQQVMQFLRKNQNIPQEKTANREV